jgi:hypothetical protein
MANVFWVYLEPSKSVWKYDCGAVFIYYGIYKDGKSVHWLLKINGFAFISMFQTYSKPLEPFGDRLTAFINLRIPRHQY